MESENDREREPLPESIFDDFGAIWDPPKRPKIDQNLRVLPGNSVFVLVCVGFLDFGSILAPRPGIWTPLARASMMAFAGWAHFLDLWGP